MRGVVRLGAERVQFPENFLCNEFEGAADRFVLAQMMRELGEVTFEPGQFFRDVGAIGEKRNFLQAAVRRRARDLQTGFFECVRAARRDIFSRRRGKGRGLP